MDAGGRIATIRSGPSFGSPKQFAIDQSFESQKSKENSMRKHSKRVASLCCALALVVLSAVGIGTRAVAAAEFPVGSYTLADYTLTFGDAGQFRVMKGDQLGVEGEYSITGEQLRLTDKQGPFACGNGQETGTYTWKYEGDSLTLSAVSDPCGGRAQAIAGKPWKRKP
jgi:hypothetical protein